VKASRWATSLALGQLKTDDAVRIIRQAAAALDHAHAQGLVHRDIKPENILLHEGEAMVADFGIAMLPTEGRQTRLTSVGMAIGTPAYMSPEQAVGELQLDARSDVYALACCTSCWPVSRPSPAPPRRPSRMRFTDVPPSARVPPCLAVDHAPGPFPAPPTGSPRAAYRRCARDAARR
jgi:serine/threonine protein kinase